MFSCQQRPRISRYYVFAQTISLLANHYFFVSLHTEFLQGQILKKYNYLSLQNPSIQTYWVFAECISWILFKLVSAKTFYITIRGFSPKNIRWYHWNIKHIGIYLVFAASREADNIYEVWSQINISITNQDIGIKILTQYAELQNTSENVKKTIFAKVARYEVFAVTPRNVQNFNVFN